MNKARKIQYLDGLRGLAAWVVVLCHLMNFYWPQNYSDLNSLRQQNYLLALISYTPLNIFFAGNFAVFIFFVQSGFVLSYKHLQHFDSKDIQGDAFKRYFRLAIPAIFSIFAAWVLIRMHILKVENISGVSNQWLESQFHFEPSFLKMLKQGAWDYFFSIPPDISQSYNSSLWTIQAEFLGSIIVFATIALASQSKYFFGVCMFLGLVFMKTLYFPFFIGLGISYFFIRQNLDFKIPPFLGHLMILLGIYLGTIRISPVWPFAASFGDEGFLNVVTTLGAGMIIIGILGTPIYQTLFSREIFQLLGKLSYSVYLVHIFIIFSLGARVFRLFSSFNLPYIWSSVFSMLTLLLIIGFVARFVFLKIDDYSVTVAKRVKSVFLNL